MAASNMTRAKTAKISVDSSVATKTITIARGATIPIVAEIATIVGVAFVPTFTTAATNATLVAVATEEDELASISR